PDGTQRALSRKRKTSHPTEGAINDDLSDEELAGGYDLEPAAAFVRRCSGEAMTMLKQMPSGCRMPAEWEPHEATWIAWPHNAEDWPGKFQAIQWAYVDIVRHLSKHERVHILVNDQTAEAKAQLSLDRSDIPLENIHFHPWVTDRVWTRDSGPIFIKRDDSTQQVADLNW